jgi:hypothetical protein
VIHLPGSYGYPEAMLSDRVVLYPALATDGSNPGVLRSMKAPQAMWTLKAADVDTGGFVTVAPSVGRFHRFTFGAAAR